MFKFIGTLFRGFFCAIGDHDWTSAVNEGLKPTQKQLDDKIIGFWDYAKMYCKRCGKISDLNR